MTKPTLLPNPTYLHLNNLDASDAVITDVVTTTAEEPGFDDVVHLFAPGWWCA